MTFAASIGVQIQAAGDLLNDAVDEHIEIPFHKCYQKFVKFAMWSCSAYMGQLISLSLDK